jgi:hypothetical protein
MLTSAKAASPPLRQDSERNPESGDHKTVIFVTVFSAVANNVS